MTTAWMRVLGSLAVAMVGVAPAVAQGPIACLQGRVFGGPGMPIAGARVTVMRTGFTTTTDDAGRYVFLTLPADSVTVRVSYVGHTSVQVDGLQLPAGGAIRQDFVLEAYTSSQPQPRDAGTSAAARSGSTPSRAPAARCPATLPERDGGNRIALPVDPRTKELIVAPGTRTVGPPGDRNTYVDGVPVQSRVKATDSTTGRIEGVIRSEAGARLAGVRVTIIGTTLTAVTDSIGRFTLASIPPGMIAIRVTRDEYRVAEIAGLRIRGGQLILQDVVLARAP